MSVNKINFCVTGLLGDIRLSGIVFSKPEKDATGFVRRFLSNLNINYITEKNVIEKTYICSI